MVVECGEDGDGGEGVWGLVSVVEIGVKGGEVDNGVLDLLLLGWVFVCLRVLLGGGVEWEEGCCMV